MKRLSFEWSESASLANEVSRPLKQASLIFGPHARLGFITLWRLDGVGVKVRSEMHDVAERRELGVLCFSYALALESEATVLAAPPAFHGHVLASKLLIEESGTTAESGLILKADREEIVIVASADPYCLAVKGLEGMTNGFEPEYPLDSYKRVDLPN
jgi:hypothetical protein